MTLPAAAEAAAPSKPIAPEGGDGPTKKARKVREPVNPPTEGAMLGSPRYKLRSRGTVAAPHAAPALPVPPSAPPAPQPAPPAQVHTLSEASELEDGVVSFTIAATLSPGAAHVTLPLSCTTPLSRARRLPTQADLQDASPDVARALVPVLPAAFNGKTLAQLRAWFLKHELVFGVTLYREDGRHVRAAVEAVYEPSLA